MLQLEGQPILQCCVALVGVTETHKTQVRQLPGLSGVSLIKYSRSAERCPYDNTARSYNDISLFYCSFVSLFLMIYYKCQQQYQMFHWITQYSSTNTIKVNIFILLLAEQSASVNRAVMSFLNRVNPR